MPSAVRNSAKRSNRHRSTGHPAARSSRSQRGTRACHQGVRSTKIKVKSVIAPGGAQPISAAPAEAGAGHGHAAVTPQHLDQLPDVAGLAEIGIDHHQPVEALISETGQSLLRASAIRIVRLISRPRRRGAPNRSLADTGRSPASQPTQGVVAGVVLVKTAEQTLHPGVGLERFKQLETGQGPTSS